jgi:hypothetical protein
VIVTVRVLSMFDHAKLLTMGDTQIAAPRAIVDSEPKAAMALRAAASRSCLMLAEQPHVLDGDHRLVREGLQEGDLFGREWSWSSTRDPMAPIGAPSRSIGTAR